MLKGEALSTGLSISPTRNNYDLVDPALTFRSFNILAQVGRCRLTQGPG